jgi:hypothetical protein
MDRFHESTVSITVVEAGGFSAAACRLGNSQSGISKSISYSAWELPTILAATSNGRKWPELGLILSVFRVSVLPRSAQ